MTDSDNDRRMAALGERIAQLEWEYSDVRKNGELTRTITIIAIAMGLLVMFLYGGAVAVAILAFVGSSLFFMVTIARAAIKTIRGNDITLRTAQPKEK